MNSLGAKGISMIRILKLPLLLSLLFAVTTTSAGAIEKVITHKGKKYEVLNIDWYRAKTEEVYRTVECGGGVGMKVVKTPTKDYMNKMLTCGNVRTKDKLEYKGEMFNTWDGNTYNGSIIIKEDDPDTLIVHGCVLGGLICVDENLTRVKN